MIPDRDFAVIVLVNSDRGAEAYKVVADAMIKAFTKIEPKYPVAAGVDPSVLDPFVGVFKGNSQNVEIRKKDGKYVFVQHSALTKGVDPAPANLANTAEGWFIITEGPNKGALGELLEIRLANSTTCDTTTGSLFDPPGRQRIYQFTPKRKDGQHLI